MNLPVLPWLPYVAIVLTKIFFGLGFLQILCKLSHILSGIQFQWINATR